MPRAAKKKVGRPPGRKAPHRPVVSARVPEAVYAEIKEAAIAAGRTMGEELIWRATSGNLNALLRSRNWRFVHGAKFGAANWISPDNHAYPPDGFINEAEAARPLQNTAQQKFIEEIARAAVNAVLEERKRAK